MSSLVADVLQSTGKLAKENIVLKVDDLKRKLENIKLEVAETLNNRYVEFIPQYVKLHKLLDVLKDVSNEYEYLYDQIEREIKPQMLNSVAEFHDILDELKRMKNLKSQIWSLASLYHHMEDTKHAMSQLMYLNAACHMIDFENAFKEFNTKNIKDIQILCALKTEFYVTKEEIIYQLENIWKQNITINLNIESKNKKNITLTLNKNVIGYEDVLKALYALKNLSPVLKDFGKQFLKLVCETLILNHVKITVSDVFCNLTIDIVNEQSPNPSEVFENLKTVFDFIHDGLLHLPVSDSENFSLTGMNLFGQLIAEDFITLIVDKCIKQAIPSQSKELDAFRPEISAAENFSNDLVAIGFFASKENSLLNFIRNVDVLPVNKIARDILCRARQLMKKSLHQTITKGIESSQLPETENSNDLSDVTKMKNGLSKLTFAFPQCQISISIEELVKLLIETKNEAKNIGPTYSFRLYDVAKRVCELYCSVSPTFHKAEIENIPQQTAIFHNNCMYLAHELCILGCHFESDLPTHSPMVFVDIIPQITKLGTETFLKQMRHQKQQLLQLIQDQLAFQNMFDEGSLINKAEKSIKQCLCQLQLLKKVWSDVLPKEVYFKAIGTLLNTVLEEIILRVLSMEDIAADTSAQMDSMFDILLLQGPDLFKLPTIDKRNFVHLYVRKWFKFQELQLILRANMQAIVERWANGKGPLAAHFTAEDVKHLIRALFQNTERRAAALAKIK